LLLVAVGVTVAIVAVRRWRLLTSLLLAIRPWVR
jgi:hypothetical protein